MSKKNLSHDEYWNGRALDILQYLDRKDIDVVAEIEKAYREQAMALQKEVFAFFTRYADENNISYQEAVQRLRSEDLSDYQANANRYREQAEKDPELLKRLNEQYASARATRLETLHLETIYRAGVLAGVLHKRFENYLKDVAGYSYRKAVGGHVAAINKPALEETLRTSFNGRNYSQQIWGNTDDLATKLKEVFKNGFIRGDGPQEMARAIRKEFNVARSRAETLVRTDGTAIMVRATIKRYQDEGLKYYRILVKLDNRTTEICRGIAKENKLYLLDEAVAGVTAPPFHYNCRSTIMPDEGELSGEHVAKSDEKMYNQGMDTSMDLAKSLLDKVSAREPNITKALENIVSDADGRLEGLDFKLKSLSSLSRKIESDALIDNISLVEASEKIKDVLRYTTIFDPERFESSYDQMKGQLIEQGFDIKTVKNTWLSKGPYKGVNTFLEKDGLVFEMQYHTQESFDLKDGPLHELYEKYRDVNTSDRERMKLFAQMMDLSKQLKIPKNIERVK